MFDLEMAIEDAIFRIKREYERTNGQIYLAFSGGKDSTVLANLIKMANLSENIPFVFVDTGIEMNTIKEFAKNFDYDNVIVVKPRKPYAQVIKEYGSPALSKLKSSALNTYQRHLDDPFKTARARQMITGLREKMVYRWKAETVIKCLINICTSFIQTQSLKLLICVVSI